MTLNPKALAFTSAILSATIMLIIGTLGKLGFYLNGFQAMQQWHIFFSLSIIGILAGIVEAAIFSFIIAYLFAIIYNKFG